MYVICKHIQPNLDKYMCYYTSKYYIIAPLSSSLSSIHLQKTLPICVQMFFLKVVRYGPLEIHWSCRCAAGNEGQSAVLWRHWGSWVYATQVVIWILVETKSNSTEMWKTPWRILLLWWGVEVILGEICGFVVRGTSCQCLWFEWSCQTNHFNHPQSYRWSLCLCQDIKWV